MRLLAGLGLLSPPAIVALIFGEQSGVLASLGLSPPGVAATILAGAVGVSVTSLIVWLYMRVGCGRLVRAAEKIAEGDMDVRVMERGGGLDGRLAAAINGISASMAEK